MKVVLLDSPFGILAFEEKGNKIVSSQFFPKNPSVAAEKILQLEAGKITDEVKVVIRKLKENGFRHFVFENASLARAVRKEFDVETETMEVTDAGEFLRSKMAQIALNLGFIENEQEFNQWVHQVSIELTKLKVREAIEKRDLMVVQAIQTIDDIDKTTNLFIGRIREWYGLHFPELNKLVERHETYARIVLKIGQRENLSLERLKELEIPEAKVEKILKKAKVSMGASLREQDVEQIQAMCKITLELYERRKQLEKYVEEVMEEVAPNIKALAGALLGARLIALAGGLENLAKMPASTIQVLGAEKALFRALRTGTRPPKHGIIFQHAYIREAKKWQRGKIARAFAGKLAIAARTDAYSGKFVGDELKSDLEKRIEEIREKYAEPPPRKFYPKRKIKRRGKKRGRS